MLRYRSKADNSDDLGEGPERSTWLWDVGKPERGRGKRTLVHQVWWSLEGRRRAIAISFKLGAPVGLELPKELVDLSPVVLAWIQAKGFGVISIEETLPLRSQLPFVRHHPGK